MSPSMNLTRNAHSSHINVHKDCHAYASYALDTTLEAHYLPKSMLSTPLPRYGGVTLGGSTNKHRYISPIGEMSEGRTRMRELITRRLEKNQLNADMIDERTCRPSPMVSAEQVQDGTIAVGNDGRLWKAQQIAGEARWMCEPTSTRTIRLRMGGGAPTTCQLLSMHEHILGGAPLTATAAGTVTAETAAGAVPFLFIERKGGNQYRCVSTVDNMRRAIHGLRLEQLTE